MRVPLPVYYDWDLTGLTFTVRKGGRRRKGKGVRVWGTGEEKLIQPKTLPLPELRLMHREASFHLPAWQKQMGKGSNSVWSPSTAECEIQQFD